MDFSMNALKKIFFQKRKSKGSERRSTFLLSSDNVPFDVAEAYNATRTNVIFSLADKSEGCKTIILTSAMPAEGKTTMCINLALSFAQTEAKILVIDADLRKPKIHTYLNCDNSVGLTNVLAGFTDIESAIKKHSSGFDYITSGHIPPNPVELLSSTKMTQVLNKLSESYDYIFIDTPPTMVVTDASALAKNSTGVILVARYMYTTRENLERAISNLKFVDANILGILMNNSENSRRKAYKRSYSNKYYKYYDYKYSYDTGKRNKNK